MGRRKGTKQEEGERKNTKRSVIFDEDAQEGDVATGGDAAEREVRGGERVHRSVAFLGLHESLARVLCAGGCAQTVRFGESADFPLGKPFKTCKSQAEWAKPSSDTINLSPFMRGH